jgi:hypothetical protein
MGVACLGNYLVKIVSERRKLTVEHSNFIKTVVWLMYTNVGDMDRLR